MDRQANSSSAFSAAVEVRSPESDFTPSTAGAMGEDGAPQALPSSPSSSSSGRRSFPKRSEWPERPDAVDPAISVSVEAEADDSPLTSYLPEEVPISSPLTSQQQQQPQQEQQQEWIRVPKGYLWVTGDNLSNSSDSRLYGPVPIGLVRGKIVARVWPDSRWFGS